MSDVAALERAAREQRALAPAPLGRGPQRAAEVRRLLAPRARLRVEPLAAGALGGAELGDEVRRVARRALRHRPVAVRRIVHVEARVHGRRVRLVDHRGVEAVEQEHALAEVRREEDEPVRHRQVRRARAARDRPRARASRRSAGGAAGLREVEREQRAAARVAEQDDAREAARAEPRDRCPRRRASSRSCSASASLFRWRVDAPRNA